jgi:hypothetical protein
VLTQEIVTIHQHLDSLDDKKAEEILKQKKQDIMRRRRQTYEESILIKNLQMIHSSYGKRGEGSTENLGSSTGAERDKNLEDNLLMSSLVLGMFPTGIPPRPQKEIIEEIKVMKILEK